MAEARNTDSVMGAWAFAAKASHWFHVAACTCHIFECLELLELLPFECKQGLLTLMQNLGANPRVLVKLPLIGAS